MSKSEWRNVKKGMSCPICGKDDWCSFSSDGNALLCRRENNGKAIIKKNKSGEEYYLYYLSIDDRFRFSKNTSTAICNTKKGSCSIDMIMLDKV